MILLPTLKPCQCKLDEAYEEENDDAGDNGGEADDPVTEAKAKADGAC